MADYLGARVWYDVAVGATAPTGAADYESTTMNALEADIIAIKPGETFRVKKDPMTGFWPSGWTGPGGRTPIYTGGAVDSGVAPTTNPDVLLIWQGPDPSPGTVSAGTGPMRDYDERHVTS